MPRRKAPQIADDILDQLLPGTQASAAFDQGGLLDQLKKALAERALNAEMDHHLDGEAAKFTHLCVRKMPRSATPDVCVKLRTSPLRAGTVKTSPRASKTARVPVGDRPAFWT